MALVTNFLGWLVGLVQRLRGRSPRASASPPQSEKDGGELQTRLQKLNGKAVGAREAWRCCVGGKRSSQRMLLKMAEMMRAALPENIDDGPIEEAKTFPLPSSVVRAIALRIVRLLPNTKPKSVLMGWVMASGEVVTVEDIGEMASVIGSTRWHLEGAERALNLAAETVRRSENDCLTCIESKVWSQATPRKWVRTVNSGSILRRMTGGAKP